MNMKKRKRKGKYYNFLSQYDIRAVRSQRNSILRGLFMLYGGAVQEKTLRKLGAGRMVWMKVVGITS